MLHRSTTTYEPAVIEVAGSSSRVRVDGFVVCNRGRHLDRAAIGQTQRRAPGSADREGTDRRRGKSYVLEVERSLATHQTRVKSYGRVSTTNIESWPLSVVGRSVYCAGKVMVSSAPVLVVAGLRKG